MRIPRVAVCVKIRRLKRLSSETLQRTVSSMPGHYAPVSLSVPTPTPPDNNRIARRRRWGILWRRSCRTEKAAKSQAGRRNFLSGALCPSPDISACGSRCGSTKNRKNKLAQKVVKTKEIPPESMDSSGILELLPRFELGTSSLPTDCQPREYRFPVLLGHFCYGEAWSITLFRPLSPSAFFRVWVTVWVKLQTYNSVQYLRSNLQITSSDTVSVPQWAENTSRPHAEIATQ